MLASSSASHHLQEHLLHLLLVLLLLLEGLCQDHHLGLQAALDGRGLMKILHVALVSSSLTLCLPDRWSLWLVLTQKVGCAPTVVVARSFSVLSSISFVDSSISSRSHALQCMQLELAVLSEARVAAGSRAA